MTRKEIIGWALAILAIPVSIILGILDAKLGQDPSGVGVSIILLLFGCGGIMLGAITTSTSPLPSTSLLEKILRKSTLWILLITWFILLISPTGDRLISWMKSF